MDIRLFALIFFREIHFSKITPTVRVAVILEPFQLSEVKQWTLHLYSRYWSLTAAVLFLGWYLLRGLTLLAQAVNIPKNKKKTLPGTAVTYLVVANSTICFWSLSFGAQKRQILLLQVMQCSHFWGETLVGNSADYCNILAVALLCGGIACDKAAYTSPCNWVCSYNISGIY